MKAMFAAAAATGLLVSVAAFAQNDQANTQSKAGTDSQTSQTQSSTAASRESLRQEIKSNLEQAGFSDVKLMPDSFLVRARDKSGHPIAMIINPDSITEVVAEGATPGSKAQASDKADASSDEQASGSLFTQVPATDRLSSSLVGTSVYDQSNQDIGTIKDVAYQNSHVAAYIVGVGGFLGMGDHYVAVSPSAMNISYDHAAKKWHAEVDATESQIKSAPAYTYPNNAG
jgi:hypothetical protein